MISFDEEQSEFDYRIILYSTSSNLYVYERNNYILVITDYFTKWVEVIALQDWTAETTCKALVDRIINYHGPPRDIVTDRGTNFTSEPPV